MELASVFICSLSLAKTILMDLSVAMLEKVKKDEAKYPPDRYRGRAR